MIAGWSATEGVSDTLIEGAAAEFEVAGNADAGDVLASLRSAAFRCASARGIVETPIRRSR